MLGNIVAIVLGILLLMAMLGAFGSRRGDSGPRG